MTVGARVVSHYARPELASLVEESLQAAGVGSGPVPAAALHDLDQFHSLGLTATKRIAHHLGVTAETHFLDVGSGFGGPARYLAAQFGCSVTGVDLTPEYVAIAQELARRTQLDDRVQFLVGDATALPFPASSFDAAWTLHVGMNVPDKAGFYAEIARVLCPGARFAVFDYVSGEGGPVQYPLMWAPDAETSFLVSEAELVACAQAAGFCPLARQDLSEAMREAMVQMQSSPPANPSLVMRLLRTAGPGILKNLHDNLNSGALRLVLAIFEKAA